MRRTHLGSPISSDPREGHRSLGPLGTAARVVAGGVLILIPLASDHGLTPWDVVGALVVLPALSVALDRLLGSYVTRTWAVHLSALALILGIAVALTYVTPIDAPAIWLFLGASLLIAAARGDAGCEAVAIPNALRGRRERTGCVAFAGLDALEAQLESGGYLRRRLWRP